MKIRWTSGSIRLRITPTEMEALQHGDMVQETLILPDGAWSVHIVPNRPETTLVMENGALSLLLSRAEGVRLAEPEVEGVYFQAGDIRYYLEKDFPCTHPRPSEALELPGETFIPSKAFLARKES